MSKLGWVSLAALVLAFVGIAVLALPPDQTSDGGDRVAAEARGAAIPGATAASHDPDAPGEAVEEREPRHVSLLIGIGAYKHPHFITAQGTQFESLLTGTTNDVRRMQRSLRGWGFDEGQDQLVLLDDQATRQGIGDAFAWLARRANQSDDIVVIYFSGHGSWAPDQDIDEIRKLDEDDGFDEALVPWDTYRMNDPLELVLDDEIGHWLSQVETQNVTVIIDSCHSGTATRGSETGQTRARGPRAPRVGAMPVGGLFSGVDEALDHTLLTGAASHELAWETVFDGLVFGQFTYHFTEVLDSARRGSTTYDDVIRQVHSRLGVARQTPQLDGDGAAVLFRVHAEVPQRSFALATPRTGGRVQFDVGSVHGTRAGAVYDVYGPQETSFRGTAAAQVRVDSVSEMTAYGTVIGTGQVPQGGRAVLSRVPVGADMIERLRVYVHPSAHAVRDELREYEAWIELRDSEVSADAVLRARDGLFEVLVAGEPVAPVQQDYTSGRARGNLQDATVRRGYEGSADALCGPLRRAYSIAGLQLIQSSSPDISVDIRVLPSSATPPDRPALTPTDQVYVGDQVSIYAWVMVNNPEAVPHSDIFLTVAGSGYTMAPAALWPRGGVQANPLVRLNPDQVNRPIPIVQGLTVSPVTGIETLKILAGTERYDFRSFMDRLPVCVARGLTRSFDTDRNQSVTIQGWATADRRVEFLPRP